MPGRHVKCIDQSLEHAQAGDFPNRDVPGKCQAGEQERLQRGQKLRHQQHPATVPAVNPDARDRGHEKRRDLTGKTDDAQQKG